jgi:hypothetical protein
MPATSAGMTQEPRPGADLTAFMESIYQEPFAPFARHLFASASLFRRTRVPAGGLILPAAGTR